MFFKTKANEHSYEELENKSIKRETPIKTDDTTFDDSYLIPMFGKKLQYKELVHGF